MMTREERMRLIDQSVEQVRGALFWPLSGSDFRRSIVASRGWKNPVAEQIRAAAAAAAGAAKKNCAGR